MFHKPILLITLIISMTCHITAAVANDATNYPLKPIKVTNNTYVVLGDLGYFTPKNGGAIQNSAFIITQKGVVVIDSGPSKLYGATLLKEIKKITNKKVTHLILTHHHPDHAFGSQAFLNENKKLKLISLKQTHDDLEHEGDAFLDNLYRLSGNRVQSTELTLPNVTITPPYTLNMGDRQLKLLAYKGHSNADLVIWDSHSHTLFAGDLLFNQRAPATPHANLAQWQESLSKIKKLSKQNALRIIPGHGPIANNPSDSEKMIQQTSDYLTWLEKTIKQAVEQGDSMVEAMRRPIPPHYLLWGAMPDEYYRSVVHLYPSFENSTFETLHP